MISASDPLSWRPRIRREPDPRQGELFGAAVAVRSYISAIPMPSFAVPQRQAEIPRRVPLQIVSSCAEPPGGDGWLHEVAGNWMLSDAT
jgi:hypothetical protein